MGQEFYMEQPKEIKIFSNPSYKHYMNSKEMVKRFIEGHKKINLDNRKPFDLEGTEKKAKELFKEGKMYFLKEGKIYNVTGE